jgi:osmotically-inducible protein OsmY
VRTWFLVGLCCIAVAGLGACREQTHAESAAISMAANQTETASRVTAPPAPQSAERESESDLAIRRALRAAIDQDPDLKNRSLAFSIHEGDITATGTVRTETERQKVNELAMQITGVKSVANAVRVSQT